VTYTVDGPIGLVTLNRGDKLNAISPDLKKRLVERLHEADRDPATRVVVSAGRGAIVLGRIRHRPPAPRARTRKGNALAWHESLTDDVALEMTPWDMRKPVVASGVRVTAPRRGMLSS